MADALITPYATALPYLGALSASWMSEYDKQRCASYDLYDDLFNNSPDTYRMMLRTSDEKPIYVPTAKHIVGTLSRYVGRGWGYAIMRDVGTPASQEAAKIALESFFKRERLLSQFNAGKKEWLRRGDWVWYLVGDPEKPEGKRISAKCIDPRFYFPIADENDPDRLSGASMIEETILDNDEVGFKMQRWLKKNHPEHPEHESPDGDDIYIWYDCKTYLADGFDSAEDRKVAATITELTELTGITAVPLYHIRNNESASEPFGRSDLSGVESVIAGVNQAVSDEDLSLALMGLGMYWTDSGAPDGGIWKLGPNRVIEVGQGSKFNKVAGITSVTPFQDHIKYLQDQAFSVTGVSDVALGTADSTVASSGVALGIRLQPLFDAAQEKDDIINSVMTQFFYDLKTFFDIYEGINFLDTEIVSVTDDQNRIPFDRDARWKELLEGYDNGLFSAEFVLSELTEHFGYEFPEDMLQTAQNEKSARDAAALSAADPYNDRVSGELASPEA